METDAVGTPIARVARRKGARGAERRLLFMGHIDEIGLIVTHIDDDGYLWFGEVGGWDPQILVGQRVVLDTRKGPLAGVVGKKPIHLLRGEEAKKVAELRELHIDVGARDGAQARELVRVGDVAVIDAEPVELPNGRLTSRALDNRIGSYVALEAARLVAKAGGCAWEVVAVAAAQEETTFGGSRTSAFSLAPDAAIVLDVTHATDAPGIEVKRAGAHALGSGAAIGRGSFLNPAMFELLHDTAEAPGDPVHDRGVADGTPAPTPTRSISAAAACRRRSSACRCATCTRRSNSSSSRTSRPAPACSPTSPNGSTRARASRAEPPSSSAR